MMKLFHKLAIKIVSKLGLAIDIHSCGKYPSYMLSNFYPHEFIFEGIRCGSMEGFLQSLKTNNLERQRMVCGLSKKEAKNRSIETWKKEQNVYWNGKIYNRHGNHYQFLLRRAYRQLLSQSPQFRKALIATGDKRIYHTIGKNDPRQTIITENEFCAILTELRNELFCTKLSKK